MKNIIARCVSFEVALLKIIDVSGASPSRKIIKFQNGTLTRLHFTLKILTNHIIKHKTAQLQWEQQIEVLEEQYPHFFKEAQPGNFGLACYSKQPLEQATLKKLSKTNDALFVKVQHDGRLICLVGVHPYPPSGSHVSKLRNSQIKQLSDYLKKESIPKIVVGDFNSTSWSPYFGKLLSDAKLFDSRIGFGVQATWHAKLFPFLRIPIDHCLHSKEFAVQDRKTGPNIGSDHLPVVVTVALKQ